MIEVYLFYVKLRQMDHDFLEFSRLEVLGKGMGNNNENKNKELGFTF